MKDSPMQSWVDTYLGHELYKAVSQNANFLEVGRQQFALEKQRDEHRLRVHRQWSTFLNIYFVAGAISVGSLAIGITLGINLPEGIVCRSEHTLCYHLRLRQQKTIL
ncbi:MAG: hypothetical protein MK111_26535 [Crocosphaera sp.]|uniref:hypothetical protein n=1 Tax=unclassified Crocosphaera TaxID=2623705 RepID=UPI002588B313|nr:hypothetical protein [Crocosphaera sp.]MCH2248136.1 hypothetical protein [Crocosphaera sp.]